MPPRGLLETQPPPPADPAAVDNFRRTQAVLVRSRLVVNAALNAQGDDLLDEATVEHASAKDLIAQLESASPADDLYDAKVTVLGEYIKHHVKEEQEEMFPKCRKAKMDLRGLGTQMAARKKELA